MSSPDYARRKRSYERNLGYARLWTGVGLAVLSLFFTFLFGQLIDLIDDTASQDAAKLDLIELAVYVLSIAAAVCFNTGIIFWLLYRYDDLVLVRIEQANQEATP